jgi:hypothetical protein
LNKPLIRVRRRDGFLLKLYDLQRPRRGGPQHALAYKFYDNGRLIFKGEDYGWFPLHAIDSIKCVCGLLSFLSLRPGDTDRDYFDDYTPEQLAWCQSGRAEALSLYVHDTEECLARKNRR